MADVWRPFGRYLLLVLYLIELMTKTEATQLVLTEYASWLRDTIADDKYFYEYATEEPTLFQALDIIDGLLPAELTIDINVSIN